MGNLLLAAFLILFGLAELGLGIPSVLIAILALVAGILLLVGR